MTITRMDAWFLALSLLLALFFWYIIFQLRPFNFWAEMAGATLVLGGIAIYRSGTSLELNRLWTPRPWIVGAISAVILYLLFWLGKVASQWIFPTSPAEISAIYAFRSEGSLWLIMVLLLFPIGPCEEIFWRGFVQSSLSKQFGKNHGFLVASLLYGIVHIWAGNLMLLLAALTCGLFWGWLYKKEEQLPPVIISHTLWDVLIFVVIPVQ